MTSPLLLATLALALLYPAQDEAPPAPSAPPQAEPAEEPPPPALAVEERRFALVGGTLHTMVPGEEPAEGTLLVEGTRIAAVGAAAVPEGFETIDVSGMHVVPGLIDGMANHDSDHDALYVAAGVTLIRDNGNALMRVVQEKRPEWRDRVPGPDIFAAGLIIDGFPPATVEAVVVPDAIAATNILPRYAQSDIEFFSLNAGLGEDAWRRTIVIGHEYGFEVWGYLPSGRTIPEAIQAGMDGLFSTYGFLAGGADWAGVEVESLAPIGRAMARAGMGLTPLVHTFERPLLEREESPPELDLLGAHYIAPWIAELVGWRTQLDPKSRADIGKAIAAHHELIAMLHAAGVPLVPGSGAPNPWLVPGASLHDELGHFVRAGLAPAEVLRLATAGAAEVLGVAEERGSLAAGKIADLVVAGADPRGGLSALRDPEIVMVRGILLERPTLRAMVEALRKRQVALRAELNRPVVVERPDMPEGDPILVGQAEHRFFGQRTSSECFAVVRGFDGRTSYGTRLVTPAGATLGSTETQLVQHYEDKKLVAFELRVSDGQGNDFEAKGLLIGGLMSVERRMNGVFQDNNRARDPVAMVDIGSVLSSVLLGQHLRLGANYVLYFENLDPVVSRWIVQQSETDRHFRVTTGQGRRIVGLGANGLPLVCTSQTGNSLTTSEVLEVKTFGGSGLSLPEERVLLREEEGTAGAPAEAADSPEADAGDGDAGRDGEQGASSGSEGDEEGGGR